MNIVSIMYLVNKATNHVSYAGEVPETYGNITGLSKVSFSVLRELEITFGEAYKGLGFFTEAEALGLGVAAANIAKMKAGAWEMKWSSLNVERFNRIQSQRWRIDRNADEVKLSLPLTEDIAKVLLFCQEIRDLPRTNPDPFNVIWPVVPA